MLENINPLNCPSMSPTSWEILYTIADHDRPQSCLFHQLKLHLKFPTLIEEIHLTMLSTVLPNKTQTQES